MANIIVYVIFCALFSFFFSGIFLIRGFIKGSEFNEYLKKKYYQKWRELTTINKYLGPNMANPFKSIPYIYSDEDCNDENILKYKDQMRINNRYYFIGIISFFINLVVLLILSFIF